MKKLVIAILVISLVIVAWIAFRYVWISHYNRGSNYMTKGKYDQAILCFDKTIKIKPKFGLVQFHIPQGNTFQAAAMATNNHNIL
ncbi:MAG: tetratricopeptide repeat protein, partial [Planctomycetes bacterium]|nr:tetratricopeptide repeat protein [Planctomycetota bacterium]